MMYNPVAVWHRSKQSCWLNGEWRGLPKVPSVPPSPVAPKQPWRHPHEPSWQALGPLNPSRGPFHSAIGRSE